MPRNQTTSDATAPDPVNEVHLVGRQSGTAETRVMPSGDEAVVFRLVVPRTGSTAPVDVLDCIAWRSDVRRRAARGESGTWWEVRGSLRRRFWRTGAGPASRTEIEVAALRRAE